MRIRTTITVAVSIAILVVRAIAQTSSVSPSALEAAKFFGFTEAEIQTVRQGTILTKELKEGSDKELAGVVAIFFAEPMTVLANSLLEGDTVKSDPSTRAFYSWTPGESVDKAFSSLQLEANERDEINLLLQAATGSKLNLANAEIQQFRKLPSRQAVSQELQTVLRTRYEAYRSNGLKGILPYIREGKNTVSVADQLAMAIKETKSIERLPGFSKALLNYPADSLPDMQHRFFAYKEEVDGRPTFILSHRVSLRSEHEALITEQRYYVSHTYDCRFIASHCIEVPGGTLLFYAGRTFTDQVAGMGSGLKHSIGRKRMLSDIASDWKDFRRKFQRTSKGNGNG